MNLNISRQARKHNLAKVGVGRSNRLTRSIFPDVQSLGSPGLLCFLAPPRDGGRVGVHYFGLRSATRRRLRYDRLGGARGPCLA